jgi:hypothetical protein
MINHPIALEELVRIHQHALSTFRRKQTGPRA